jgi:hypothetical protein
MILELNFSILKCRAGTLSFLYQKRKKHALFSLFFPKTRNSCITVVKYLKSIIFKVFEKNKEKKSKSLSLLKKEKIFKLCFFLLFSAFY